MDWEHLDGWPYKRWTAFPLGFSLDAPSRPSKGDRVMEWTYFILGFLSTSCIWLALISSVLNDVNNTHHKTDVFCDDLIC